MNDTHGYLLRCWRGNIELEVYCLLNSNCQNCAVSKLPLQRFKSFKICIFNHLCRELEGVEIKSCPFQITLHSSNDKLKNILKTRLVSPNDMSVIWLHFGYFIIESVIVKLECWFYYCWKAAFIAELVFFTKWIYLYYLRNDIKMKIFGFVKFELGAKKFWRPNLKNSIFKTSEVIEGSSFHRRSRNRI